MPTKVIVIHSFHKELKGKEEGLITAFSKQADLLKEKLKIIDKDVSYNVEVRHE